MPYYPDIALLTGLGVQPAVAREWAPALREACVYYGIDTPNRVGMFCAQIVHESTGLTRLVENLNYSAAALVRTWPTRFSAASASSFARQPMRIANHVYANRLGNGGPITGDGWKYRGRGPMQATGKDMYKDITQGLRKVAPKCPDFVANPDALLDPTWGALAAGYIWTAVKKLNPVADAGNFDETTRRINGGQIGQAERRKLWAKASRLLAVSDRVA